MNEVRSIDGRTRLTIRDGRDKSSVNLTMSIDGSYLGTISLDKTEVGNLIDSLKDARDSVWQ